MKNTEVSILVVDDEESVRHILSVFLSRNGYACSTAGSAEEAMALMKTASFNLVITDIAMPGASGFDLCRYVKDNYPKTAVVIITGLSDTKYVSEAVRLGVIACLLKPFNLSQVSSSIERAVRLQSPSHLKPPTGSASQETSAS